MAESILQRRLTSIYNRAKQENNREKFGKILKDELMPLVESNSSLIDIWDKRMKYYLRLAEDEAYLSFIDDFHNKLVSLQKVIDREKLKLIDNRWRNYFKKRPSVDEDDDWIAMPDLYDLLSEQAKWHKLGVEDLPHEIGDAFQVHWKPVLGQYTLVDSLIRHAEYHRAIPQTEEAYALVNDVLNDIKELHTLLEQPMQRYHIHEFEWVDHFARQPEWITDGNSMNRLKDQLEIVYTDLVLELEENSQAEKSNNNEKTMKSTGRRAIVRYKGGGKLDYKGNEYEMAKDSIYANVSEKVYEHCQQVGSSITAKHVFEAVRNRSYESNPIDNWKWLYHATRSANRWAKRKDLPTLFECTTEGIKRLV